jgi:undecaprenyl-diphosphatase
VLLAAVIGGTLLSESLKFGFSRPRPDLVAHAVETMGSSFPSGHATLSAAAYLTIGAILAHAQNERRVKTYIHIAAVLIALMIGVSRVYLGVHWPSDVLAGWSFGTLWALAWWSLGGWLRLRSEQAAPALP